MYLPGDGSPLTCILNPWSPGVRGAVVWIGTLSHILNFFPKTTTNCNNCINKITTNTCLILTNPAIFNNSKTNIPQNLYVNMLEWNGKQNPIETITLILYHNPLFITKWRRNNNHFLLHIASHNTEKYKQDNFFQYVKNTYALVASSHWTSDTGKLRPTSVV